MRECFVASLPAIKVIHTCFLWPFLMRGRNALVTMYVPTTFVSSTSRRSFTSLQARAAKSIQL